ncbi:MEKHLA domain-containing protein [Candidatus Defluviicoccus seviourii]|uniref:MEKHLA domain-containing protein n=1 Tax=Candidatus Defluviicoccus seviourii TaxID=2565273 RepID=A0A564WGX1_9PROT|nr:MEKHLA domain-containing protein [Candidatus Defluviicoccus seviourii]
MTAGDTRTTGAPFLDGPSAANGFLGGHTALLAASYLRVTGQPLIDPEVSAADAGRWLFEAPFAILSHGTDADPLFTYGNRCALRVFELTWPELIALPSRLSAEPINQAERARLLARVRDHGFIDDYAGVRISRTGRRFLIRDAIVWNLKSESGDYCGQAARFEHWEPLPTTP